MEFKNLGKFIHKNVRKYFFNLLSHIFDLLTKNTFFS